LSDYSICLQAAYRVVEVVAAQKCGVLCDGANRGVLMSVDADTVRRIAHLARIAVAEDEVEHLKGELNAILAFVEQLSEVNVEGVEPMTSVTPMEMKKRADEVTDGGIADDIVRNAPATEGHFFLVPKVVE
jgi:aspartyl-tRNA(Asn)/glutamyl-tRNA(Gln) amidotransferase subunit C